MATSKSISKAELNRQDKFCLYYVVNRGNAAQAYRDAYPKCNPNSARQLGYLLLQNLDIQKRIRELKDEHHEHLMATHKEILQEVSELATFDPIEMLDPESGRLLTLGEMPPAARKSVNEIEMIIGDDDGVPFRMAKVKYGKDKKGYLDMLMKHYNQYEAHRIAGSVQPMTVMLVPEDANV